MVVYSSNSATGTFRAFASRYSTSNVGFSRPLSIRAIQACITRTFFAMVAGLNPYCVRGNEKPKIGVRLQSYVESTGPSNEHFQDRDMAIG